MRRTWWIYLIGVLGLVAVAAPFLWMVLGSFKTQGGPLNSTISVSMYTYNQFGFGNYGLATAMAYILFVVIAVVTFIQFRLLREK